MMISDASPNKSKVILITGSSRGLGAGIARLAHKQGYTVILHGKNDSAALRALHTELAGSFVSTFDVGDRRQVTKAIADVEAEAGSIDVLVNNAGIIQNFLKDISEMDEEKALDEYRTNVLGPLFCIQAVLPGMLQCGAGSVINISSMKGLPNLATMSGLTYAASKSALNSVTKSLAKTYSPKGVRFNAVLPGYVETDQTSGWSEVTYDRISQGTLLGRAAQAHEIAPLVLFLASDESAYVTGSEYVIDGGYSLGGK